MTSFPLRIMVSVIALAFVAGSPADAKSRKQRPVAAPTSVTVYGQPRGANLFPPGPIYYGNEYLGNDPDPFIRLQIWRDLGAHFGGAF